VSSVADLTVVIPVRNDADSLRGCLDTLADEGCAEIIVVDGNSTDDSVAVAKAYGATVLSDEGLGLPYARSLGAQHASTMYVALVDADVMVTPGDLARLLEEFVTKGYAGLQAGLQSTSGPGYWGQALVFHHRNGRSKDWFGVVATIFAREVLLQHGFDTRFLSGEDIELRWRLQQGGHRVGVSRQTIVEHRFTRDDYAFARGQFLADGMGLGRMVRKQKLRGLPLLMLPLAAAVRGVTISLIHRRPAFIPYFGAFLVGNYAGMARALRSS
jgi:glycosyltransferase involved in cell wall biosynthesis